MTIGFILNGEDVIVRTEAENRLVDILRGTFGVLGTKAGCHAGNCGACSIILNGEVVKACLIPVFKVRDCEIITIEGFSQTNEYNDIVAAFSEAGVENCGFCDTGKILAAESLLSRNRRPGRAEILEAFHGIKCRCTEPESLVRAVTAVAEKRRQKRYGRSS